MDKDKWWKVIKNLLWLPIAYYAFKGYSAGKRDPIPDSVIDDLKNMAKDFEAPIDREDWESDRFNDISLRRGYDDRYRKIRSDFDSIDLTNHKTIKNLKDLAMRSQELTQRYRSIDDEIGVNRSARLHEEIEEAAERLVPIYDSWKRKKITVGVLALTAGLGFWKGDYIRDVIYSYSNPESSLEVIVEPPEPQIPIAEIAPQDTQEIVEEPLEVLVEEPKYKTGIMPHEVTLAGSRNTNAKYALYFNFDTSMGALYDLPERQMVTSFGFTGNETYTPHGYFDVMDSGIGDYSPMDLGSAFLEVGSERRNLEFFVSGTYSYRYSDAIKRKRHWTTRHIAMDDLNMLEIYSQIRDDLDRTIIVVEK